MDVLCRVCAHQVRRSRIDVGVWKLSLAFVRMPAKIGLNRYDSTIELQLTYVYAFHVLPVIFGVYGIEI